MELNLKFGRGSKRGQFSRRHNQRGSFRKSVDKPTYVRPHVNDINDNGTAAIPGGKGKLVDYFVKNTVGNPLVRAMNRKLTEESSLNDVGPIKSILQTKNSPKSSEVIKEKMNEEKTQHSKKAVVPGGRNKLRSSFVSASRNNEFTIASQNVEATVHGSKSSFNNYIIQGSGDHFKPQRSGYYSDDYLGNTSNNDYLLEYDLNVDGACYRSDQANYFHS